MWTHLQYRLLRWIAPYREDSAEASADSSIHGVAKLRRLLGDDLLNDIRDRIVLDFGCGGGIETVALAQYGARLAFGLDIRESVLSSARLRATQAGVADRCQFGTTFEGKADIIVTIDAFEHFSDPAAILHEMSQMLAPDGCVYCSFGYTWFHPLGGHLFSVFPWAHLVFSESALIRWRSDFKSDGATRFEDVEGGLNRMTIRKFEQLVANGPLDIASSEYVPIRPLRWAHNAITREFTTAAVRYRLRHR